MAGLPVEHVLPRLMQRADIDLWIVLSREYNEDPVMFTLLPATCLNASRLTGFVYALNNDAQVDCYSITSKTSQRYAPFYESIWDKDAETQYECLMRLIADKDPQRIGIDVSETFALADGLSKTLYDQLTAALDDALPAASRQRRRAGRRLAGDPLAAGVGRLSRTQQHRPRIDRRGVLPARRSSLGVTTTTDLEYAMLQRAIDLGLGFWFHFDVDIQRRQDVEADPDAKTIMPGDLLHCDVGLIYKRLKTDTQRLAYVLREGETAAPVGLQALLRSANQFQDIVTANFVAGAPATRYWPNPWPRRRPPGSTPRSTTTPSASTDTRLDRPWGCGITRRACPDAATTRSTPTPATRWSSTPRCPCRSGTTRSSRPAWSRPSPSPAARSSISMAPGQTALILV